MGATGIVDENNNRYATFSYNSLGQAVSSQHAGGADLASATYGTNSAQITDVLGKVTTYTLTTLWNVTKPTAATQTCNGCPSVSSATTYDAAEYLASKTDFNGNVTNYTYDDIRGLETQRVEASGASAQRTINTTWDANFRVPEPAQKITKEQVDAELVEFGERRNRPPHHLAKFRVPSRARGRSFPG